MGRRGRGGCSWKNSHLDKRTEAFILFFCFWACHKVWKILAQHGETSVRDNTITRPEAQKWGCTCQELSNYYRVNQERSWGCAPKEAKTWCGANNCRTRPQTSKNVGYMFCNFVLMGKILFSTFRRIFVF